MESTPTRTMFRVVSRDKGRAGLPFDAEIDHLVYCFESRDNAVAVVKIIEADWAVRGASTCHLVVEIREYDPELKIDILTQKTFPLTDKDKTMLEELMWKHFKEPICGIQFENMGDGQGKCFCTLNPGHSGRHSV